MQQCYNLQRKLNNNLTNYSFVIGDFKPLGSEFVGLHLIYLASSHVHKNINVRGIKDTDTDHEKENTLV